MLVPLLLALALPAVSSSQGEGFVNQYASEREYSDGKTFRFVSESIENIGAGWRARETYGIVD